MFNLRVLAFLTPASIGIVLLHIVSLRAGGLRRLWLDAVFFAGLAALWKLADPVVLFPGSYDTTFDPASLAVALIVSAGIMSIHRLRSRLPFCVVAVFLVSFLVLLAGVGEVFMQQIPPAG